MKNKVSLELEDNFEKKLDLLIQQYATQVAESSHNKFNKAIEAKEHLKQFVKSSIGQAYFLGIKAGRAKI